jgi:benzoyl-CoA reductase/2-hydroxyglutaryl-CoA dehydratase subunit BcrC/BadD/HgdB
MNFKKSNHDFFDKLLSHRLSKSEVNLWVERVSSSHEMFEELIDLLKHETGIKAFQAAWILQYAAVNKSTWFYPHLPQLLERIKQNPNESVNRALVRVLWKTKIPEKNIGLATQYCMQCLENTKSSIAVKAFSCHVLFKLIDKEPELCLEIREILERLLPFASSGLANSIQKLLTKIRGLGY